MENLPHAVTSKQFSNRSSVSSNGFVAGKTVYDDVFGGPPKFGGVRTFAPRVEDYNEIFGGFHASRSSSTIPVLDLPIIDDERLVCFDVKSSKFNYSEVFGGFDFHFSCDELFDHAKTGDSAASFQEKEAWFRDPAENESLSAKSAPSTYSGKSQSSSNEDQSFEDINQGVNSHREAKQRNTDGTRNGTHCTESPIIPGFTFIIDKFTPSDIMEDKNVLSQVNGGININSDFIEMDLGVKQFRKTMSHPPNNIAGIQTIGKGIIKPVRNYTQNGSHRNKPFLTVSEINLRTDPSELSPPLRPPPISKVDSSEALGDSSPPYFDVEVDASSSATASAAAMKQAMEQAQAKLRSAKELMERKKECLQNRSKNGFKDKNVKITKLIDGSNRLKDERVQAHEENSRMEVPYFVEGDGFFDVVEKSSVQRNAKESWSSQHFYRTDAAGEWKEANAILELVKTDKGKKTEFKGQPSKEKKKTASEACEFVDNRKEVLEKSQRKEDDILKLNVAVEIITQKDERNKLEVTHHKETEKSMASAGSRCDALVIKSQSEEKYMEFEETMSQENKHKLKASNDRLLNGKRLHGTFKRGGDKKQFREGFHNVESEENSKQNLEKDELEKRVREVQQQEELEKSVKEAQQRVEHERRVLEALEHREREKKLKVDLELKENEKKQAEAREREDIDKKIKKGFERKENEKKLKEAFEKEVNERKQKESHDREECEKGQREREVQQVEKRLREACKRERNENGLEEGHKIPEREKTAAELMNSSHDTAEGIELKGIQDAHESTVPYCFEKRNFDTDQGTCVQTKTNTINTSDEACKLDDNITRADKDAVNNEVKTVNVEATIEISAEEMGEKINTEPKVGERVIVKKNGPCDGRFEAYGTVHDNLQDKEIQRNKEEELKPVPRDPEQSADILGETAIFSSQTGFEENIENTQMSFDREKMDDNLVDEFAIKVKNNVQEEVAFNRVPNKSEFSLTQMRNKGNENNNKTGTAASCTSEGKCNTKITAEEVKTRQSSETIEKIVSGHHKLEKTENYERMKVDDTLEEDHLQKLNEEREREREREKDRMAVERATREVREKSYAESRERAERAALEISTAEVRQRALAEARERLVKACTEVREKSLAEKSSTEARIRAERAAVERATAEARGRASEKAMAERAAFEARERAERSAFSASRIPHSAAYSGVEVESAQRCKARLERHQRTAERAAKALAEKNTRDLISQREQAERNKLSESLDADVKRWSSGKEGNLRALLSTLQYILGPDSGWQPIPLTDVITAVGVKKAYRKATLCVHPDKLQQRRASIQQKYICDKVFDLLKEAWNKFNSEER